MAASAPPRLARLLTTFGQTPQLISNTPPPQMQAPAMPQVATPQAPAAPQAPPADPLAAQNGAYGPNTGPAIQNYDPMEGLPVDADPEAIRANAKKNLAEALPNWQSDPLQAEMYAAGVANIDFQIDSMVASGAASGGGGGGYGGGGGGYGGGGGGYGGGSSSGDVPTEGEAAAMTRLENPRRDQRDVVRDRIWGQNPNAKRQSFIDEVLYGDGGGGLIDGHVRGTFDNREDIESRVRTTRKEVLQRALEARKGDRDVNPNKKGKQFLYNGRQFDAKHPFGFALGKTADKLFGKRGLGDDTLAQYATENRRNMLMDVGKLGKRGYEDYLFENGWVDENGDYIPLPNSPAVDGPSNKDLKTLIASVTEGRKQSRSKSRNLAKLMTAIAANRRNAPPPPGVTSVTGGRGSPQSRGGGPARQGSNPPAKRPANAGPAPKLSQKQAEGLAKGIGKQAPSTKKKKKK